MSQVTHDTLRKLGFQQITSELYGGIGGYQFEFGTDHDTLRRAGSDEIVYIRDEAHLREMLISNEGMQEAPSLDDLTDHLAKDDDGSKDECLKSDQSWGIQREITLNSGGEIQSLEKEWAMKSDGSITGRERTFDQGEFERIGEEGIAFLNKHFHPHAKMIITTTGVEIVEGSHSHTTHKYIKD